MPADDKSPSGDSSEIRWLHISDIHCGANGEAQWQAMMPELERHLRQQVQRLGAPDLVLISGDLASQAKKTEYQEFGRFLSDLREWLGGDPVVIPTPGNHDLRRPAAGDPVSFVLDRIRDSGLDRGDEQIKAWFDRVFCDKTLSADLSSLFAEYEAFTTGLTGLPELVDPAREPVFRQLPRGRRYHRAAEVGASYDPVDTQRVADRRAQERPAARRLARRDGVVEGRRTRIEQPVL